VLIKHRIDGRTYYTLYQHVAKLDPRIPLGGKTVRVKRGQRIGRTGRDEGAASLIHLHFELLDAKLRAIDPYQIYKTSPYYPDPAGRNRVKAKRGHFWLQNPPQPPDTEKSTRRAGKPETSPAASPLASPATVGASPGPSTVPTACGPPAAPSPVASASVPPLPSVAVLAPPSAAASPAMIPAASCAPIASFVPLPSPGASFIVLASPAATAPPA
jgi:hypothetical protein